MHPAGVCDSTAACVHVYFRVFGHLAVRSLPVVFALFLLVYRQKLVALFAAAWERRNRRLSELQQGAQKRRIWTRSRCVYHAIFWLALWPIISTVTATIDIGEHSITQKVPKLFAFAALSAGTLRMLPEFLFVGALLCILTTLVFGIVDSKDPLKLPGGMCEAALAFAAMAFGIAAEFPAVLRHPLIGFVRSFTTFHAYWILAALIVFCFLLRGLWRGRWRTGLSYTMAALGFAVFAYGLTQVKGNWRIPTQSRNGTVILGIDSISQSDDVAQLRNFAAEHRGRYFENAVTPGLLTNAVWTSIIMHRPVDRAGVVLTYQTPDWNRSPYNLVTDAKSHGFETWSFFDDQFTSYVGSVAGFDHDESGPLGWLQLSTASVKEASVLLPLLLPRLPHIPFAFTPANQSGTFGYDLRSEVKQILNCGGGDRAPFVMAHLSYLHSEAYPRFADLTEAELETVLRSKVDSLRDLSFDWQYPTVHGDMIGLYSWKLRHLQQVITSEIDASKFLDPLKNNRLVILSDHGNRGGLYDFELSRPQYYNVLFITFGLPVDNEHEPISLTDLAVVLGFHDASSQTTMEPTVKYTNFRDIGEWQAALQGAEFKADGRIDFSSDVVENKQRALASFRPFARPEAADGTRDQQQPGFAPKSLAGNVMH